MEITNTREATGIDRRLQPEDFSTWIVALATDELGRDGTRKELPDFLDLAKTLDTTPAILRDGLGGIHVRCILEIRSDSQLAQELAFGRKPRHGYREMIANDIGVS